MKGALRCAACQCRVYDGELVCRRCAFCVDDWEERFGADDALSSSPTQVSAGRQRLVDQGAEFDQFMAAQGNTDHVLDEAIQYLTPRTRQSTRELLRAHSDVVITGTEAAKIRAYVPGRLWGPFAAVHARQKIKRLRNRWQKCAEAWTSIGLAAWADQMMGAVPGAIAPRATHEIKLPSRPILSKEMLDKIDRDHPPTAEDLPW